mmetsp:Transcript_10087/g.30589  ORF Transcript_10087/g.30589 Transcript_10087/m.30589 type:complete len:248 (+) Transcript_10087:624-1367(+)
MSSITARASTDHSCVQVPTSHTTTTSPGPPSSPPPAASILEFGENRRSKKAIRVRFFQLGMAFSRSRVVNFDRGFIQGYARHQFSVRRQRQRVAARARERRHVLAGRHFPDLHASIEPMRHLTITLRRQHVTVGRHRPVVETAYHLITRQSNYLGGPRRRVPYDDRVLVGGQQHCSCHLLPRQLPRTFRDPPQHQHVRRSAERHHHPPALLRKRQGLLRRVSLLGCSVVGRHLLFFWRQPSRPRFER